MFGHETRSHAFEMPAYRDGIRDFRGGDAPHHIAARRGWFDKAFLFERVYRHERVMSVMRDAERIVADLFAKYRAEPAAMAEAWHEASQRLDDRHRARLICDFVGGMTDRFAIAEHRRLFDATPNLR